MTEDRISNRLGVIRLSEEEKKGTYIQRYTPKSWKNFAKKLHILQQI